MNRSQIITFWMMFLGFCITGTLISYQLGIFERADSLGGSLILVVSYLIVGFFIRHYVVTNREEIDRWFR